MNRKRYRQLRALVIFFVGLLVGVAVNRHSYLLAAASVFTGMVFLVLVRTTAQIITDEREQTIREKAAHLTYAIFAPTIGLAAFFLLLPTQGGLDVFSKGEWLFVESLGMIFAYLSLFLIAIYGLSYFFYNHKFGTGGYEE